MDSEIEGKAASESGDDRVSNQEARMMRPFEFEPAARRYTSASISRRDVGAGSGRPSDS
jgi:hypothetical protein